MNSISNPDALAARPRFEIAEIFRRFRAHLGPVHLGAAKVIRDIIDCRTRKLGGHVRQCTDCEFEEISYNSCRNRHCPKCQFLARLEWTQAREDELLPVEYFHVVFTLPDLFNPMCLQNKKEMYDLIFQAASETLKEVGHRQLKEAEMGFIAVLHTWGQNLLDHPHLHVIVPGGGLKKNQETSQDEWVPCKKGYLFPIQILSQVFRGKFLSGLEKIYDKLKFVGKCKDLAEIGKFKNLLKQAARKEWVVYAKKPFAGPKQVIQYLGNYTHRIAISNHRIIKVENDRVHFRYRDYSNGNQNKVMILDVLEFMRRFLLHVLPHRFMRIRHYGFLGNRGRLDKIKRLKSILIPLEKTEPKLDVELKKEDPDWKDRYQQLTGVDLTVCQKCRLGRMEDVRVIESFFDRRRRELKKKALDRT